MAIVEEERIQEMFEYAWVNKKLINWVNYNFLCVCWDYCWFGKGESSQDDNNNEFWMDENLWENICSVHTMEVNSNIFVEKVSTIAFDRKTDSKRKREALSNQKRATSQIDFYT